MLCSGILVNEHISLMCPTVMSIWEPVPTTEFNGWLKQSEFLCTGDKSSPPRLSGKALRTRDSLTQNKLENLPHWVWKKEIKLHVKEFGK